MVRPLDAMTHSRGFGSDEAQDSGQRPRRQKIVHRKSVSCSEEVVVRHLRQMEHRRRLQNQVHYHRHPSSRVQVPSPRFSRSVPNPHTSVRKVGDVLNKVGEMLRHVLNELGDLQRDRLEGVADVPRQMLL